MSKSPLPCPAAPDSGLAGQTHAFGAALRASIASRLAAFEACSLDDPGLRHAAVVLALVRAENRESAAFLLTQRPETLRRHAGQFALPGGRVDAGESDCEAALRELREELGLRVDSAAILGCLDDFPTRSGFRIRPFVAWVEDDAQLRPDPQEIARCYRVPLQDLDAPSIPTLRPVPWGEYPVLSVHLDCLGDEVFAPTAAMIYQFREVALAGRTTRVSHFEQPRFAWR